MRIKWYRKARQDLRHVRAYIAEDNPQAAAQVAAHILQAVERLPANPGIGRPDRVMEKLGRSVFFDTSPDLPRIIEVDLARLRENPDQPRKAFDENALQELADSIARHGLIQPIAVAPDPNEQEQFIVVAGGRRYRAFQILNRETIPAIITQGNLDEIALIENIQRQDLSSC